MFFITSSHDVQSYLANNQQLQMILHYIHRRQKTVGLLKGIVIRARQAQAADKENEEVSTIAVTSDSDMSMEAWYSYPLQFDSDCESHDEAWVKQTCT